VLAFSNGALGTVLGTAVAFALLGRQLGPDGSKVAAALCASYIGGSVNFAGTAALLGLTAGPVLAGAMTADNCAMAVYLTVLYLIPAAMPAAAAAALAASRRAPPAVTAESLALALAAAALACAAGNAAAAAAGFASGALAFSAAFASGLAALGAAAARRRPSAAADAPPEGGDAAGTPFSGAEALGGALMMLFFATIGAGAGGISALGSSGWLLAFILVQLSVQLAWALGVGTAVLRLPMPMILITANANVGGPATAAAMAASKGWRALVQPALLTGSLGYAVANGVGWGMGVWMRGWYAFPL
jgi:uncharacterized membrane protein